MFKEYAPLDSTSAYRGIKSFGSQPHPSFTLSSTFGNKSREKWTKGRSLQEIYQIGVKNCFEKTFSQIIFVNFSVVKCFYNYQFCFFFFVLKIIFILQIYQFKEKKKRFFAFFLKFLFGLR